MENGVRAADPVLMEVIRNRLETIVEEMEVAMIRAAYSPIIADALDATAALFDLEGQIIAQSTAIPAHLQMLTPATRRVLEDRPVAGMRDGDVFIMNDPYLGGTHHSDVAAVMPIFYDGSAVMLATTMAHHQDVGGPVPGSNSPKNRSTFADGLRIPVVNLYTAGVLEQGLLAVICHNSRMPGAVNGDMMAQVASCKTGVRRAIEAFDEFGLQNVQTAITHLLDRGEFMARSMLERIPDGAYSFSDYIDSNGVDPDTPTKVAVTITVRGSDVTVDFEGTDPASPGGINCVLSSVAGGALGAIKSVMGTGVPNNEGAYRPITLVLPEGTLVNPAFPHSVGSRTITMRKIWGVVQGALAKAVPDLVPAACDGSNHSLYLGGIHPTRRDLFVTVSGLPAAGGWGARPDRDGMSVQCSETGNMRNFPVEAFEGAYPFRVRQIEVWPDSGGAGRWRGGCGYHAFLEVVTGTYTVSSDRDRHVFQPWGLLGGRAAPTNRLAVHRHDGTVESFGSTAQFMLSEGDALEYWVTGGGGYGLPIDREPWRVRDDVRHRMISREAAGSVYGVVFVEGGDEIDFQSTEARRAEIARTLPRTPWMFDRGAAFEAFTGLTQFETTSAASHDY